MSTLGRDLPLSLAAPDTAIRIREVLDRAGYSETHILERLGLARLPPFRLRGDALPLYRWRTREGTALDSLVRLFVLQQPIPLEAARHALAPMDPEEWVKVGLLRPGAAEVGAAFELCCYQGLVAVKIKEVGASMVWALVKLAVLYVAR